MRATTTICPGPRSTSKRRPTGRLDSHNRWTARGGLDIRLYTPTTGRFLTQDPIQGGNATTYGYPPNPISDSDVSGCFDCTKLADLIIGISSALERKYNELVNDETRSAGVVNRHRNNYNGKQDRLRKKIKEWHDHCGGHGSGGSHGFITIASKWASTPAPFPSWWKVRYSTSGGYSGHAWHDSVDWHLVQQTAAAAAGAAVVIVIVVIILLPVGL